MGTLLPFRSGYQWRNDAARFARFLVVGASGILLDFVLLTAFKLAFGLPTLPANVFSYSCGIINNYLLSRMWVYPDAATGRTLRQLAQFSLISMVGLALNNLLVWLLEHPAGWLVGNEAFGYIPAKMLATGVVLLWNYLANRIWTFRVPATGSLHSEHDNQAGWHKRSAA